MSVITDLENEFKALVAKLEAEGEVIATNLHSEALLLEAKLKTEIVLLRQRAANLASDAEVAAEEAVIYAKGLLDKVLAWIKNLEQLAGKYSTVKDYNTGAKFDE